MKGLSIGRYRFRAGLLPTLVSAALLACLVGLGVWQLGRADEKTARVQEWERRGALVPRPLGPEGLTAQARERLLNAPIVARGHYDGGHQFLLDNRTEQGRAGFHVLTPLRLEPAAGAARAGGPWAVIVNRGWVALGPTRDALPLVPAPAGRVEVSGVGAAAREDQLILGAAGYAGAAWPRVVQRVEIASMEGLLGYRLHPLVLLLAPDAPGGYVRSWQPYLGITPEKHMAYAFQWFALAAALVVIYIVVNGRRAGADEEGREPADGRGR